MHPLMEKTTASLSLVDCEPGTDHFREDVLAGLQQENKSLPCKYFYDERGSRLFEQICELDEYYLTRTEIAILQQHVDEIAAVLGAHVLLIEYGSGSSAKTRILLERLPNLAGYVPIDISREHLLQSARQLVARYPSLAIHPVCADYTAAFTLPDVERPVAEKVIFFPGSTIGNFEPERARALLARMAGVAGPGGGLLIGIDLKKEAALLEAAYNDRQGVTEAFNKNLLRRINRQAGGTFDLDNFAFRAVYNPRAGRVESYLVSRCDQRVEVDGRTIAFEEDETIHTENSYKYSRDEFAGLAASAGWTVQEVWVDEKNRFSVQYLTVS